MRSAHQHANENIITSCQSSADLVYLHESVDPPLGYHRRMKMGGAEAQLMMQICPDTSCYFHSSRDEGSARTSARAITPGDRGRPFMGITILKIRRASG